MQRIRWSLPTPWNTYNHILILLSKQIIHEFVPLISVFFSCKLLNLMFFVNYNSFLKFKHEYIARVPSIRPCPNKLVVPNMLAQAFNKQTFGYLDANPN